MTAVTRITRREYYRLGGVHNDRLSREPRPGNPRHMLYYKQTDTSPENQHENQRQS